MDSYEFKANMDYKLSSRPARESKDKNKNKQTKKEPIKLPGLVVYT